MARLLTRTGFTVLMATMVACGGSSPQMPTTYVASSDGSGVAPPGEPVARAPLAAVGERMTYRVALHGVPLAELVIHVTGEVNLRGRDVFIVEVRVDTNSLASMLSPVHDRFTTWIDARTGEPLQFHATEAAAKDGGATEVTGATFAAGEYPVRLVIGDNAGTEEVQVVRGTPWDFASFLVFLRGWEAPRGTELTADVMRSRWVWRVRIVVSDRGNLQTALGDLPVISFEGEGGRILRDSTFATTPERRRFTIWISDDADRVPVKLAAHTDYGDVLLELIAYDPGT